MRSRGGEGREARGPTLTFCITRIWVASERNPNFCLMQNQNVLALELKSKGVRLALDKA